MSKVLIWNRVYPGSELDIFTPTNYETLYSHVQEKWGGRPQNWGNRLWFQGIYSAINNGENTYDFLGDVIDPEQINAEYDFIILSLANIFNPEYAYGLRRYAELFSKIRIPVYVIACGVQADNYADLPDIASAIKDDAQKFIQSVYRTGGEFALRGHFTKKFFDLLGFHSAVVTGCPSLFQLGPDFRVPEEKVSESQLFPVFNGSLKPLSQLLQTYSKSTFIDQCNFFDLLYNPDSLHGIGYRRELRFINNYGYTAARLLAEGRLIMIADMNDWFQYLRNNGFNYALGSRIHGTIMALLSGIPATILTIDSRTKEMAEFFEIPSHESICNHTYTHDEFLSLYEQMDYRSFNRNFRSKYDAFEEFLSSHGIVSHINTENPFFGKVGATHYLDAAESRRNEFLLFSEKLHHDRHVLSALDIIRKIKNKFV